MQKASREYTFNLHGPGNAPQFTVEPGEEFLAETELCSGSWLTSIHDTWAPEKATALNPTVCVAVRGAQPGMLLAVDILDIEPDKLGYTGFGPGNTLARAICPREWGMNVKTVRIEDGLIHWSDTLKLPIAPMIGTLGAAPRQETLSNARGGPHGGNMDVQEVRAGSTVYLPVEVEGALLHIGDVHALQGDGEINNAGGIECRSIVRLRARLLPRPEGMRCVRMEDESYLMAVACERSLEESFTAAAGEMLRWMVDAYGYSIEEAYLLMGQLLVARNTQMVNPTRSTIVKMPKQYLQKI